MANVSRGLGQTGDVHDALTGDTSQYTRSKQKVGIRAGVAS